MVHFPSHKTGPGLQRWVRLTEDESSEISRAGGQHCLPGMVSNSDPIPKEVGSH